MRLLFLVGLALVTTTIAIPWVAHACDIRTTTTTLGSVSASQTETTCGSTYGDPGDEVESHFKCSSTSVHDTGTGAGGSASVCEGSLTQNGERTYTSSSYTAAAYIPSGAYQAGLYAEDDATTCASSRVASLGTPSGTLTYTHGGCMPTLP